MCPARSLAAAAALVLAGCGTTSVIGGDAGPLDASSDAMETGAPAADGGAFDASTPPADVGPCTVDAAAADVPVAPLHTPRWAFEPWISKDISTTDDTYAFVDGFRSRDIPVGAVVLDSPWETQYSTFAPNPVRYHDFDRLVSDMHGRGVRVVLWTTQLVNQSSYDLEMGGDTYVGASPNFDDGLRCGFFVEDGRLFNWWKGRGAGVDFFNPRALGWWHAQQDRVLDAGIDGWKLDFGDSYVDPAQLHTAQGVQDHQAYSEAYYRDFRNYAVSRRGPEFTTMVRAWDQSYQFSGRFFARREDAPIAWMGDNRRDWVGLEDALDEMFRSAQAGYVVLGSDVGGYLDRDDRNLATEIPFSVATFARWTAVGALSPFMQLHGRANLTPWTTPDGAETLTPIYRYYAKLHHALVPYLYALAEEAYAGGEALVRPFGSSASWPHDYSYGLGPAFFVAPVLTDTGHRAVTLPDGEWYSWFSPERSSFAGGQPVADVDLSDLSRIGLWLRSGAIVPLAVEDDALGFGAVAQRGSLTLLVIPDPSVTRFWLHEDAARSQVTAQRTLDGAVVTVGPTTATVYLRVRFDPGARTATVDGTAVSMAASRAAFDAAAAGFWVDAGSRWAWVKLAPSTAMRTVRVGP